ncbi:MAG: DMT family transporter [Arenibacterium sp.]
MTLGFVWGAAFPVIEIALEGISPLWLAAYRIALATVLTFIVWRALGGRLFAAPLTHTDLSLLVFVGLLSSAFPFMLIAWGQQYVTAGFTGVAMATVALFVLPLAHFMVPGERITWRKTAGFLIGFAGILVLMGPDVWAASGTAAALPGQIACVAAAGCYALSSILMRRLPSVDPIGLSAILLLIGALAVPPIAWSREGPPVLPPVDTLVALAYLGLIPTAAANLLRVMVIRSAGPVFMSLTNYQVPVWSVVLGVAFLGEPLHLSLFAAMALIFMGVGLSQYGALKRLFRRRGAG